MSVSIKELRKRGPRREPPPKRKAPPRKKHVVKVKDVRRDRKIVVDDSKIAGAHQRRVTLNLLRHAACTPDKLRKVLDKLPKLGWDLEALKKNEAEIVFGLAEKFADQARDEFVADLQTIRDLLRHPHKQGQVTECQLCGHQHIRWEFDLRNIAGGRDTKTGSTCIETYGLNVDGYGTAEAALKALRAAINKAKDQAKKEEWQERHPDHEDRMDQLSDDLEWLKNHRKLSPWQLYSHAGPAWNVRVELIESEGRSAIKYYRRKGYLTDAKTENVFGNEATTGVIRGIEDMKQEIVDAKEQMQDSIEFWQKLLTRHEQAMGFGEIEKVKGFIRSATFPDEEDDDCAAILTVYKV